MRVLTAASQFPTVVETLGFNTTVTLVLTCPPYLVAGAVTIAVSWSSGKFNERTWHITISKTVAVIGFAIAPATMSLAGRYVAMCIFTIGKLFPRYFPTKHFVF